jgi:hydroxyacylglutathione hydrolase
LREAQLLIYSHATGNPLANIDYLVACPETGECVAVDPWEASPLLAVAKERGWAIRAILNTHGHWDHTRGNAELVEKTGAQIYCHPAARSDVGHGALGLEAETQFAVGRSSLRVLHTPGHTLSHICMVGEAEVDFLISGDTLFNAGAGNCHNGGDPETLFHTFEDQISQLPDALELLPGHDYLKNNLGFSLNREPGNTAAIAAQNELGLDRIAPKTLGEERLYNPFLRLDAEGVIEGLKAALPDRSFDTRKKRFIALRELRNRW